MYLSIHLSINLSIYLSISCFLLRTHMQDLKDVTQDIHYENFRAQRLASGDPIIVKDEERYVLHLKYEVVYTEFKRDLLVYVNADTFKC